jgi:hypothetical protein
MQTLRGEARGWFLFGDPLTGRPAFVVFPRIYRSTRNDTHHRHVVHEILDDDTKQSRRAHEN